MKTVGKQLQEARVARQWTPEMAARETKIKVNRLRDLEVDDYSHFTSPTYARGFVRTYARALGLDEYKILRQLDNKLPDDDTPNIVTEAGITYLPETAMPPRVAHRDFTGLYIVVALGFVVMLVIGFVLFEAYRVGELPGYFSDTAPESATKAPETNNVPEPVVTNKPPQAIPVDPHEVPVAPKALPADVNPPVVDTNAIPVAPVAAPGALNAVPHEPVKALPVDPSELNGTVPAPVTNAGPVALPAPTVPVPSSPPRALPVDISELTNGAPAAPVAPPVTNLAPAATVTNPDAPITPMVQSPTVGNKTPPRALPVDPSELAAAPATVPVAATNAPVVAAVVAPVVAAPAAPQSLILTSTQDSFVRVIALDGPDAGKPIYSAVLRSGKTVGFDGRKFSVHVGLPSAVSIKLDGVNQGPHSKSELPETFTLESHQP